jgi:hypothetical protein
LPAAVVVDLVRLIHQQLILVEAVLVDLELELDYL